MQARDGRFRFVRVKRRLYLQLRWALVQNATLRLKSRQIPLQADDSATA